MSQLVFLTQRVNGGQWPVFVNPTMIVQIHPVEREFERTAESLTNVEIRRGNYPETLVVEGYYTDVARQVNEALRANE